MKRVTLVVAALLTVAGVSGIPANAAMQAEQTVYYSGLGDAGADTGRSTGAWVMIQGKETKTTQSYQGTSACNSNRAVPRNTTRTFTRLVGYSLGRLGPPYYLQQLEQQKKVGSIRSIVILDPGRASQFECDNTSGAGYTYATWLRQNPANRLLIITADASAQDGYAGLNSTYASKLGPAQIGNNAGDRVLICDAPTVKHDKVDETFSYLIGGSTRTSCPSGTTLNKYSPKNAPATTLPTPTPAPSPTYSETTGGPANTWTNYTNAGGTQGPTIPGGTTVQIACKLQGFRVEDGNTWWYRIAQSPWNNQYYVSADAFYNNGQTSGSLRGTPFVDPNVRNC